MTQGIATDPELRDRFMREARAAGSLQHPNIITIYDFGETEGYLYIAMEYVEGSDLSEVMARKDPLPVAGKLDIIVDVLQALDYAHNRRVVHRDVKPGNIRVAVDGRAKLMDFGIARLEKSDLTKSGIMIGTPDYMAPEQVTGGDITPATDVFAVGGVLYEFLTGTRPFEGETLHAVLYKVVHVQPLRLKEVAPEIPPSLQPILDQALAKDPAARYPSAGAMARDLGAVRMALSGAKTIAIQSRVTPLRTLRVAERPRRRKRALWIGAGGGALAVAAVAFLVLSGRLRLPLTGDRGQPPAQVEQLAQRVPAESAHPATVQPAADTQAAPVSAPSAAAPPPGAGDERAADHPRGRGRTESPVRRPAKGGTRDEGAEVPAPPPVQDQARAPAPGQAQPAAQSQVLAPAPAQPATVTTGAPPAAAPRPAPRPDTAFSAPAPPPDPRPEIEQLVTAYAAAIESKNIGELRRAYPGLTSAQQRVWQQFFRSVRGDVKAQLQVARLDVNGNTAVVDVSGSYEYDAGGGATREPVSFRATAAREGGAWRLKTVP
jgi:serine/threonine-protein kinase